MRRRQQGRDIRLHGQAIQAAVQTDDLATLPQGVQSVGMHALCNQITGSRRTAPITKSLKCSVEITVFMVGGSSTIG
jgi:hypothetical protein